MMDAATRQFVRSRAVNRCEYCLLHQDFAELTHHIEHIIAKQHGGSEQSDNLALACHRCNFRKGPNLAGVDPLTRTVVALFHPRRDIWEEHFAVDGPRLVGITDVGRATVYVLAMNDARRIELREQMMKVEGWPS